MQAKLNKKLTEAAKDSSGTEAVEEWLETCGVFAIADET